MDKRKIGRFIAAHRKRLGMTQMQLARELGVSNKTISCWERGLHLPDYDQVLAASELFGVDAADFLTGNPDAVPAQPAEKQYRNKTQS